MGILLSFLFPSLFMSPQAPSLLPPSDDSQSSSPSIDVPLHSPLHPEDEDVPDPAPPSTPKSVVIGSPPLESRPYSPHGVGIGILSPQPVIGPFAPISRANLSPLHVRSSPSEQRSNPLDAISPRHLTSSFEPHAPRASGSRSPDPASAPAPPPPHLRYVEGAAPTDRDAGEDIPLASFSSAGAAHAPPGLRISVPPPHLAASTSTPSPPLLWPSSQEPAAAAATPPLDPGPPDTSLEAPAPDPAVDLLAPPAELNIDFSEFDAVLEGCSALEKMYLLSRSGLSVHRTFIAHALPSYLLGNTGSETPGAELTSREIIEQITPSEAVEYVLPILNGLAMDEGASPARLFADISPDTDFGAFFFSFAANVALAPARFGRHGQFCFVAAVSRLGPPPSLRYATHDALDWSFCSSWMLVLLT